MLDLRADQAFVFPLSFAQQRLWFIEQLEPGTGVYNIPVAYRLSGALSLVALERSLNGIVCRHEILRTTFAVSDNEPVQIIATHSKIKAQFMDLGHLSGAAVEAEAMRFVSQESCKPFDLSQGPLLRASVLRLAEEEHILVVVLHHIVSDGWSLAVLFREIAALYEAFLQEKPSPLPDLPIQYADFSVWQRGWLQGETLQTELSYWRKQLENVPQLLELPPDRPRPPVQTCNGAEQTLVLSKALTGALYALSRRENVTLFMTLLVAFQALLYRYTGQEDIVVGAPFANRNRREIEGLIGFFANTLPLRANLAGNPTFLGLLGQVREVCLGAYAHQDLPFEGLVEELQPERDLSRTPLFQAMFVLQEKTKPVLELPGLTLTALKIDRGSSKFDLTLELTEREEELWSAIVYNTDLFDDARMIRMLGHWRTLLESIVADPGQHLSELLILTEKEREQLLVEWNDTYADYGEKRCIHEFFEAQVERTPEAVAVVDGNKQLTYRELNQRANQLAHYLRKSGVGPEVLVGICVERSLEMVVGELAILKAGGAFVPFDPNYPEERLAFMLQDTQAPVLLTHSKFLEQLPEKGADRRLTTGRDGPATEDGGAIKTESALGPADIRSSRSAIGNPTVVCLDTEWELIARENEINPRSSVTAENLAYVIYTSGSTGKPKGVAIQHAGVANLMAWLQRVHGVTPDDRATLVASPAFDASVWELWPYLAAGASVHIVDEEILMSPPKLLQWFGAKDISISFLPTPLAEAVLEEPWPSGLALRALLTGGDKLHRSPRKTLPFRFVNKYGPTENSAVTTWAPVATGTETDIPPPIGRPIANNQVYLLDRYLNPVPIGICGELFIGGDGLARGYLNRPELTSEKFVPNPFSDQPGTRLYRTGDLARYLPDGNIEFLGRIDHQVKIRGFRIELGEIEVTLGQHPAVREVVVLAREDAGRDKRLVAYVVPNQDLSFSTSELRNFLKNKLPEYMVPASFVMLEALPLTPNGKVNRSTLRAPGGAGPELEISFVAPSTPVETILERIWSEMLKLKRVGVHDNFFELGGDSILSLQIIARANQAGLRLTPKQFFQHQTIAELAAVAGATPAIHAEQDVVTGPVPLIPIQHWFFEQELPEPNHWNTAMLLEARQALDPALLARVMRHLLGHHDALRLRFTHGESGWQQFNAAPDPGAPFSRVDLSTVPESEQGPLMEATAAELQASLNLLEGPLLRVALFELGADKPSRLLIIIHHLAVDGVSWRILLEDLETAYRQINHGESIQLSPKTTSFKLWAARLTEYAQSAVLQKELDYWLARPWTRFSPLPVDFPEGRSRNTVASARRVSVCLSVEETRTLLQEVPEIHHAQINDVLLTALVRAFSRWTGSPSLLVDLEAHGREEIYEEVDLSRTMGWFTTIFPVLLSLEEPCHPGEALKSIREQLGRIPNRGIGYGSLRFLSRDAAVAAMLKRLPQPEVSFNYLGQFDQVFTETSLFRLTKDGSGPATAGRDAGDIS
ncbi:MAG: amino acid adenylation domain-containing protein [Candidatus Binatia bacterium]